VFFEKVDVLFKKVDVLFRKVDVLFGRVDVLFGRVDVLFQKADVFLEISGFRTRKHWAKPHAESKQIIILLTNHSAIFTGRPGLPSWAPQWIGASRYHYLIKSSYPGRPAVPTEK
jgi:hypothetical protein